MKIHPTGDASEHGIGQRRPVIQQIFAVAHHRLELRMALGDKLTAEDAERLAIVLRSLFRLQRHPHGEEGTGETGVEEGDELMHPVGFVGSGRKADAALMVPPLEPQRDRHRFRKDTPFVGDQHGRFDPAVQPLIGLSTHFTEHVDAGEAVGLAEPFKRGDQSGGTAERKARGEDRFSDSVHVGFSMVDAMDISAWTLPL
ncbi:hypothetical protein D9M70_453910 [compost metagenome]